MQRDLPHLLRVLTAVVLAVGLTSCGLFDDPDREYDMPPEDDDRPWVLVDLRHTEIQNPVDYRLHRDQYSYQGTYGFHRLFEHLETYDYPWEATNETLSTPRLEPYDILFINLVHDRMPDFEHQEIEAIKKFVEDGGGLFVIGDHTNVYRHAERINPFLRPMGLEMMYHTAVDHPPTHSISGLGWVMSFDFTDHPINEDVEMLSFKTGGPIDVDDSADSLAKTSEDSFADHWDETHEEGFYGNWSKDPEEPEGPLSIAAATEYGEGRTVLVGDQNVFGDAWLHAGDNFELATNAFEWLAGNEDADEPLRNRPIEGHEIALASKVNAYQTIRNDGAGHGYYSTFIESNRNEKITARATTGIEVRNTDTLWFPSSDIEFDEAHLEDRSYSDEDLQTTEDFLRDGGQVVVSFQPGEIPEPTVQLLERLTDDFALEFGDQTWSPGDQDVPTPQKVEGVHEIESGPLDVEGLSLTALPSYAFPGEEEYRENAADYTEEDFDFYLYDVRARGGKPFVEARFGSDQKATVARRYTVGDGELIVFVQDGFWRNRTLGSDELLEPVSFFRSDIVEFHHEFLDYLRR